MCVCVCTKEEREISSKIIKGERERAKKRTQNYLTAKTSVARNMGDYPAPVIQGPIELFVALAAWGVLLVTVVFCVQKASGSTVEDRDGDGIPDLNSK